jgi:hypothetical protein
MNAVTKAEAMQDRQYRLEQERQQTDSAVVHDNPAIAGCIGDGAGARAQQHSISATQVVKAFSLMAVITCLMSFWPALAMAQEATLTDVDATVEVVHLFDYGSLAQTYLTTTGGVMAILAGVLITVGIAWGFIHRMSNRRGV